MSLNIVIIMLLIVNESTKGIREIKALDLKEKCYKIFEKDINKLKDIRTTRRLLGKNVNTAKWTIRIIGDAIILLYIIRNLKNANMNVETAMLLITYMTNIIDDVFHRIIEHNFGISEFTANMKRIKDLLEDDRLGKEKFGNNFYNIIDENIEFKNVPFSYNENNKNVLNNISFKIESRKKNAIIGMSGEGKTDTDFSNVRICYDGGSIEYHYKDYTIIKVHNVAGNRDVYVGIPEMNLKDLKL